MLQRHPDADDQQYLQTVYLHLSVEAGEGLLRKLVDAPRSVLPEVRPSSPQLASSIHLR